MNSYDAQPTEDLPADPAAEDALLDGVEDADELEVLLGHLAERLTEMPDELTSRRHLAAMRDAHIPSRPRLGRRVSAIAAVAVAASALVLASAGMLPPPVQRVASETVARVGIDWPGGGDPLVPDVDPRERQEPPTTPAEPGPDADGGREPSEPAPVPGTAPAPAPDSGTGPVDAPTDRSEPPVPRPEVETPASPPERSMPPPPPPSSVEPPPVTTTPRPAPTGPTEGAREGPDPSPAEQRPVPPAPADQDPSSAPQAPAEDPRPAPARPTIRP
jgi:hypothetical protein